MAYNEEYGDQVRRVMSTERDVTEKKMFGGLTFMLQGKMCVGIMDDKIMVRVGPARYEESLKKPHCRPMDFTGRPMKGFVYVDPPGFKDDEDLHDWIMMAVEYLETEVLN